MSWIASHWQLGRHVKLNLRNPRLPRRGVLVRVIHVEYQNARHAKAIPEDRFFRRLYPISGHSLISMSMWQGQESSGSRRMPCPSGDLPMVRHQSTEVRDLSMSQALALSIQRAFCLIPDWSSFRTTTSMSRGMLVDSPISSQLRIQIRIDETCDRHGRTNGT